jgi:2-polyprenyl-3-methyl-5-hydroxy-6-metoxy-1,4-benzoquinol methylase
MKSRTKEEVKESIDEYLSWMKSGEIWWENASQRKIDNYYPKIYSGVGFKIKEPILEIGGGAGTFLKYLKIKNATILDLVGGKSLVDNFDFIKQDITKKICLDRKFKTIFLMEVLEHIENPLYLMSQVYDLLYEDGICYIMVPYTKLDSKRKDGLNSHVCRWKDYELKDQLEKIGFNVVFLRKRRRLKNKAFWLPHCNLIVKLTKR